MQGRSGCTATFVLPKRLGTHLHDSEPNQLKLLLQEAVPEYQPFLT